jgi:hypothetical protein
MAKAEQSNVEDLGVLNPNFKGFMVNNIQANWTQCESWDHYYHNGVQFINLNHYGTLKVK